MIGRTAACASIEMRRERAGADHDEMRASSRARYEAASAEAQAVRQTVSAVPSMTASGSPVSPEIRR